MVSSRLSRKCALPLSLQRDDFQIPEGSGIELPIQEIAAIRRYVVGGLCRFRLQEGFRFLLAVRRGFPDIPRASDIGREKDAPPVRRNDGHELRHGVARQADGSPVPRVDGPEVRRRLALDRGGSRGQAVRRKSGTEQVQHPGPRLVEEPYPGGRGHVPGRAPLRSSPLVPSVQRLPALSIAVT